jgi:DNA-binding transcriptional regulator LsrR (DeoR family)
MACRYESTRVAVGFQFALALTQAQLADMLGLTAVHVNRMLTTLKQRDIVRMTGRTVHVPDWAKLRTLGDFDPGYLRLPKSAGLMKATARRLGLKHGTSLELEPIA